MTAAEGAYEWPPCDAVHLFGSTPVRCDRPALHAENGDPDHGSSLVSKRRVPDWRTDQKAEDQS